ncbi:MAG: hypothetical protein CMF31_05320 [Kordiimonas sp.]|nr:hypothetical protein [Kordiimonas sp.]
MIKHKIRTTLGTDESPWPQSRQSVTFILKWLGMITGALGAVWLALNLSTSGWGYTLFAVSSASWLVAGLLMKEHSLTSMNVIYFAINLMGIYRWLLA